MLRQEQKGLNEIDGVFITQPQGEGSVRVEGKRVKGHIRDACTYVNDK